MLMVKSQCLMVTCICLMVTVNPGFWWSKSITFGGQIPLYGDHFRVVGGGSQSVEPVSMGNPYLMVAS
jgi:hypothetical protein